MTTGGRGWGAWRLTVCRHDIPIELKVALIQVQIEHIFEIVDLHQLSRPADRDGGDVFDPAYCRR
jgi:hypothetical protein